ncbi:hypothetical protein SAMN04487970_1002179 [Paenibacillus tianmuensis]|uniref:Lipoprotein n=1 Tax=Paenibacillus tianmuensis TaxID=624147 RepID=A0A1G4PGR1_9BACL|nr:hypothetical protein [Paenibacillus tianmuensis]SCW31503.1 hypothetical protein SAMN04487970_1002179 [Paenibacillus tianmuensis]
MKKTLLFASLSLVIACLCCYWFIFYLYQQSEDGIPIPSKAILKEKIVSDKGAVHIYKLNDLQQTNGFPTSYKIRLHLAGWEYSGGESEGAEFVFKKNDGSKVYFSIYTYELSLFRPN